MKKESDGLLKKLLDNLPFCVDAMDAQGRIVFWNKACEKITGYCGKEIIGNPNWIELLYPDSEYREKLIKQWTKVGNTFRHWEMRLRAKDGKQKVISWTNISDFIAIPEWHTWAIGFDVTTYYDARHTLSLKEKQLHVLMRIQNDLQKAHTPEQIANMVLEHLETFTGAHGGLILLYDFENDRAEIVSAKFEHSLFYHAENYIPLEKLVYLSDVRQGRVIFIDDLSVYNNNVKLASLLIKKHNMKTAVLIPLMDGHTPIGSLSLYSKERFKIDAHNEDFLYHVGYLLAFSLQQARLLEHLQNRILNLEYETHEQISELKQNERRLRAQYESIPIPTYTWQKSGDDFILRDYNDMALATTYGKIGGLLGSKASEIYKSLPELVDLLQECYENEISIETQIKSTSPAQETPHYLSIKLAYVAPDSVLMHIEDITENYLAQKTIRHLEDMTQKQAREIEALHKDLTTISESLFPMIRRHLDQIQVLQEKISVSNLQNKDAILHKALLQKREELKHLLDYGQRYLTLHTMPVHAEQTDLARFIQTLLDEQANLLQNFRTHVYLEVTRVMVDPQLLKEILGLLIKFIVEHKSKERTPILRIISTLDAANRIIIRLKDNGRGVPEIERVNRKNDEREDTGRRDYDFLNMGLIERMVQLLAAEFHIISEQDEGAQFEIILPETARIPEERPPTQERMDK